MHLPQHNLSGIMKREKGIKNVCTVTRTYHESLAFRLFLMDVHIYNVH